MWTLERSFSELSQQSVFRGYGVRQQEDDAQNNDDGGTEMPAEGVGKEERGHGA